MPATFTEGRAVDSRHRRETGMQHHIKRLALVLAVLAAMVVAGPAWAAGGDDAYENGGENVAGNLQGADQGGGPAGTTQEAQAVGGESGGSALPFTGLDVALILGVGGVLMAVGLGTRRLTRAPDTA